MNSNTETTRYLASSVHQDFSFRNQIFRDYIEEDYKAIAHPYGINFSTVLHQTLNARERSNRYNNLLFIPSVIFWLLFLAVVIPVIDGYYDEDAPTAFFLLAFLALYIVVFLRNLSKNKFLLDNFSRHNFDADYYHQGSSTKIHNVRRNLRIVSDNTIVYSGYSPFVGFGYNIGGWSFVLDLDKSKEDISGSKLDIIPFKIKELYDYMHEKLGGLDIANLSIHDRIFVHGKGIRDSRTFLPNILAHPVGQIPEEELLDYLNSSEKNVRFYKVLQVIDWEGDLIFSVLLRFRKNDKNLFVENNYYLLPPIKETYKSIDTIKPHMRTREYSAMLITSIFSVFSHSIISIFDVLGRGINALDFFDRAAREKREMVEDDLLFDYGANPSLREVVSQTKFTQHFQQLDKEMYVKMIEKQIFNVIEAFLSSKNIDTSEFKERETKILNNGVIVSGGNVKADNIAVGEKASVKT